MKIFSKISRKKSHIYIGIDPNESFVRSRCLIYMTRIMSRHPKWDSETLDFLNWLLQDKFAGVSKLIMESQPVDTHKQDQLFFAAPMDNDDQVRILQSCLCSRPRRTLNKLQQPMVELLKTASNQQKTSKHSNLAGNIEEFTELFDLTENEAEVCLFLALMTSWSPVESYFDSHLDCDRLSGRKYLLAALDLSSAQFESIIHGRLRKLGFIDVDRRWLELSNEALPLINESAKAVLTRDHYRPLPESTVELERHGILETDLDHLVGLLSEKQKSATHVLLYGTPGTGKTSFARALASSLGCPSFEVLNNTENTAQGRRLGLTACLNLTNHGGGSLVVVDEADGILNTDDGWFMRGESQDKGWLNELLEEPGTRVIWITNRVENIDPSVRRRFAFSLFFAPFGRKQREMLWDSILRKYRVKRLFNITDIRKLAGQYEISAGPIDLAVSKARETGFGGKGDLLAKIHRSLAAHLTLLGNGKPIRNADSHDKQYVLSALNLDSSPTDLLAQVKRFDQWWQMPEADRPVRSFNMLYHGPSGTGKTELARYLAHELDRPMVVKRMSDLLGPYVGQTEQALAGAFAQAEADQAILLIDEADSLLFPRSRAQKSWEVSATNEFLTQMERFRGILICTTNRVKDLDNASLRRFSKKVKFGYLESAGILALYDCLLTPLAGGLLTGALRREVSRIDYLTPGMFKIVRDEALVNFGFIEHKTLVSSLKREAKMMADRSGKTIGFGSKMDGLKMEGAN